MASPTRFTPEMIAAYLQEGFWTHVTMLDLLDQHAVSRADKIALVDPKVRLTWGQVKGAVETIAAQLTELGLKRDTPLVVQLPNCAENCLIQLALKKLGLLGAYGPIIWRRRELEAVVETLRPGALVVPAEFRGVDLLTIARDLQQKFTSLQVVVVGPAENVDDYLQISLANAEAPSVTTVAVSNENRFGPFEVTKLVVTSGSTGAPKIVERPEQQQLLWGKGVADRLKITAEDNIGGFIPLSGGPGHFTLDSWLVTGAKLVLCDGFAPKTLLPLIECERLSVLMTAPAVLARLIDSPDLDKYDFGSVRVVRTGSAHLSPSLATSAEARMGCVVVNAGGAIEACPFGQMSVDDPPEVRHSSSLGKVFPGGEVSVVDETGRSLPPRTPGELWVRGPATSSGYFRNPDATLQAWGTLGLEGWFRTGDVATIDESGYVTLVGRIKDMINRGGMNVYPLELETVLSDHPKILEAAVVGIPDATLGEVPCLCVIPRQGLDVTLDEVTEFLHTKELAQYKFPARVVVYSKFPRGQTMRINRRLLAKEVLARLEQTRAQR